MKKTIILVLMLVLILASFAAAITLVKLADSAARPDILSKSIEVKARDSEIIEQNGGSLIQKEIPLGQGFSNSTYFDTTLQDDDISTLFDGKISFQGNDYDTSEELQFCDKSEPFVVTSLMSDDDYKRNVFFEMGKNEIKYAYRFDKPINISLATAENPVVISFLGKTLKIISVGQDGLSFSALVGTEYLIKEGDEVTVGDKIVRLEAVGTSNAQITIEGVSQTIAVGTTARVNGIEIFVLSVTSRTNFGESSAVLIMGEEAIETYSDGDRYIGEDFNDPEWLWDIAGLQNAGVSDTNGDCETSDGTPNNVLRIENEFTMNDNTDIPTEVGQCIDLPNKYISICFDSLTVPEEGYNQYYLEYVPIADLSDAGCANADIDSSAPAVHISASTSEGIDLRPFTSSANVISNVSSNIKVQEVWLFSDNAACNSTTFSSDVVINMFYKETNSPYKVKFFGAFTSGSIGNFDESVITDTPILRFYYENTKDSNIRLGALYTTSNWTLNLVARPDTAGDMHGGKEALEMQFAYDADKHFSSLGNVANTGERAELQWVPGGRFVRTELGAKDEDHRTAYGITIENPGGSSATDKIKLGVPSDMVKANIIIGQNIYNQPEVPKIKLFYRDAPTGIVKSLGEFYGAAENSLRIQGTNDNFAVRLQRVSDSSRDFLFLDLDSLIQGSYGHIETEWKIENNKLQSLGNYRMTAEGSELVVIQGDEILGNGDDQSNILMARGAAVLNPAFYGQSDIIRLNLPQQILFEFIECTNTLSSIEPNLTCENAIHISSNMCEDGFAIMAGDKLRFTTDTWIVVTGPRNETDELKNETEEQVACIDKDNGFDIYTNASCDDITLQFKKDTCMKTGMLKEWYCVNNRCLSNYTSCPLGFVCHNDKCVKSLTRQSWFSKLLGRVLQVH